MNGALHGFDGIDEMSLSYDIGCQYQVNLKKRFKKHFGDKLKLVEMMGVNVPKMHILAHTDDCQYRFSFDFTDGCGQTHGETAEHPWSETNQASGSTKDMNAGNRHETLDDMHHAWNTRKIRLMGKCP